jgi:sugar lactone lactonase YvrE
MLGPLAPAAQRSVALGANPESVAHGFEGKLFVSLMGPSRLAGDGDGKIVVLEGDTPQDFASGMDDPKGLVFVANQLVTADFNRVWKVNAAGEKSLLAGPDAFPQPPVYLNDVAVAADGNSVLVTDMGARDKALGPDGLWPLDSAEAKAVPAVGRVYRITLEGVVSEVIAPDPQIPCPNGIEVLQNGRIRIAEFFTGAILEWHEGKWTKLTDGHRSADGIGHDRKGRNYVSEVRTGKVWRYEADWSGKREVAAGLTSAADLLVDDAAGMLIIPDTRAGSLVFVPL